VPWSKVVNRIGYQSAMVLGLLTMAVGAFLFLPAASAASYPLFLSALIVLAAGITVFRWRPILMWLCWANLKRHQPAGSDAGFQLAWHNHRPETWGLLILSAAPLAIEQIQQLAPRALHLYRVEQAASVKMPTP